MPATKPQKKKHAKSASYKAPARDLAAVFASLRAVLTPYERTLNPQIDQPAYYCLESRVPTYKNRPMYFAGVRMGKNYVSFHLMPVYACAELLQAMSPGLQKRKQGKACFNFTHVDPELLRELALLTEAGYQKFKSLKFL